MTSPIYVAIDTPDLDRAKAIAAKARGLAGGVKLGLEFFNHNGRQGVMEIADSGVPVFLDLKLHDIPNTVAKAVQALNPLVPSILTVHAAGGRAMMEDAKAAAPAGTKVVGVYPGSVDTDMTPGGAAKAADIVAEVIEAIRSDTLEVFPGGMARDLASMLDTDYRKIESQFAQYLPK